MQFPGYDDWKTTDPDEGTECPMCGGLMEGDKYEGWCTECDYSYSANFESYHREDNDFSKYW